MVMFSPRVLCFELEGPGPGDVRGVFWEGVINEKEPILEI